MPHQQMTTEVDSRLEMRWITVQDERGRTRLEATWIDPQAVPVVGAVHAA